MKKTILMMSLLAACGSEPQNTRPTSDTGFSSDLSDEDGGENSGTRDQSNSDADSTPDTSTDMPLTNGMNCTHTTEGGRYGHTACSAAYQCCNGSWKEIADGCGACLCTEPTGATGCGTVGDRPNEHPNIGVDFQGSQIPREGLANDTGSVGVEPFGELIEEDGLQWVRGKISHFGGPEDTGVTPTETGAITGENLRALNNPLDPTPEELAANPDGYYYLAMRWNYTPGDRTFWRAARIVIRNPDTGKMVVVRPVDWGPHTRTERIVDVSPQTERDLGTQTDREVDVAFADPNLPLGPVN